jgi:pimeloyl-ACP methyl ester carboxylesterase
VTRPPHSPRYPRPRDENRGSQSELEIVSGTWLVRTIIATLIAAGAALYLTVCLLFYQGQWQFVFSPKKLSSQVSVSQIAAASGLPIADEKFDYTELGIAHLDGWWIPADPGRIRPPVILYCPNGRTTLRDDVAAMQSFHQLGAAVFAFDYRGFGQSQAGHPSQQKAYADGLAALRYLTGTRHIDPNQIFVYGAGVGAAVAVHIAQQSPNVAGLVLENPQSSFARQVKREQHIHVLPLWLIFPDRFDISEPVSRIKISKLFLLEPNNEDGAKLYQRAIPPKQRTELPAHYQGTLYTQPAWQQAISSFLKHANAS